MPWLSRVEYDRLVRQLETADQKVESAQEALALERADNRLAERHWANMLLRRARSFPLPAADRQPTPEAATADLVPAIDPGELSAMVAAGEELGVPAADVIRFLRLEKGIEP